MHAEQHNESMRNQTRPKVLHDLLQLGAANPVVMPAPAQEPSLTSSRPNTTPQSADNEREKAILRHPFAGALANWHAEAGYGFFQSSSSPRVELFAHANALRPRVPKGKDAFGAGLACIAAEGVDPRRYRGQRRDSRPCAVRWAFLDPLGVDITSYRDKRGELLGGAPISRILSLLAAKWYCDDWGGKPEFGLRDEMLLEEVCRRLASLLGDPTTFAKLLTALDQSPQALVLSRKDEWITDHISASIPKDLALAPLTAWTAAQTMGDSLRDRFLPVFSRCVTLPTDPAGFAAFRRFADALSPSVRDPLVARLYGSSIDLSSANALMPYLSREQVREQFSRWAVGLDLESDGQHIFQIACHDGESPISPPMQADGMSPDAIEKVCQVFDESFPNYWVVGHNIIAWDLPVIRNAAPSAAWANRTARVWDTLLISWYLEPWRRSHALVGSRKAHDASEDALATLNLFRRQVAALDIDYRMFVQEEAPNPVQFWSLVGNSKRVFRPAPSWLPKHRKPSESSRIKAILIDEFQDMDADRMRLLRVLTRTAQAGIMVIGDDDQDILRWNRDDKAEATEMFQQFRQTYDNPQAFVLRKNYRSGQRIVEHTQQFLREHMPEQSHRELAEIELLHITEKADQGEVRTNLDPARLEDEVERLRETDGVKNIAVLTRTNGDAALVYERLRQRFPGTVLQGGDNLPIRFLRHVASWLEACNNRLLAHGDAELTQDLQKSVGTIYKTSGIPETRQKQRHKDYVYVNFLWDALGSENRDATLKDHIDQLSDMDLDSYGRLLFQTTLEHWVTRRNDLWGGESRIVVSTIHKVKGLEFDAVVIMPSQASFPFADGDSEDVEAGALDSKTVADEVRLYYVGMTRAKAHLLYSFGGRENAWLSGRRYDSDVVATQLVGSLKEVFMGFPAKASLNCQEYIKSTVTPRDAVLVEPTLADGAKILHGPKKRLIAMLSKRLNYLVDYAHVALNVRSIVRHELAENERIPVEEMLDIVRDRKWYYTVTFEGKLR